VPPPDSAKHSSVVNSSGGGGECGDDNVGNKRGENRYNGFDLSKYTHAHPKTARLFRIIARVVGRQRDHSKNRLDLLKSQTTFDECAVCWNEIFDLRADNSGFCTVVLFKQKPLPY